MLSDYSAQELWGEMKRRGLRASVNAEPQASVEAHAQAKQKAWDEDEAAAKAAAAQKFETVHAAQAVTAHPVGAFLLDVHDELDRARKKFPHTGAVVVALMEEVGELAKAMLDEAPERIYKEAVQVATMAARCALEGDPTLNEYRRYHHGVDVAEARGLRS